MHLNYEKKKKKKKNTTHKEGTCKVSGRSVIFSAFLSLPQISDYHLLNVICDVGVCDCLEVLLVHLKTRDM